MTNSQHRILVVEDDRHLAEGMAENMRAEGYLADTAHDGRAGLAQALAADYDLLILDVMLPHMDGFALCREMREKGKNTPVLFLTARGDPQDRVRGLEAGGDDYLTKPFSPRELIARINAVLRRAGSTPSSDVIDVEGLRLDQAGHRVLVGERTVPLGPTEYRMLEFFMTHPERVYTREQLLDRVWGGNVYVEERTVDVHIRRLRKALEEFGYDRLVQTVRGAGYRFSSRAD